MHPVCQSDQQDEYPLVYVLLFYFLSARLVILGSVLMGALIVFSVGIFQVMKLKREIKTLRKENRTAIHKQEDPLVYVLLFYFLSARFLFPASISLPEKCRQKIRSALPLKLSPK